jgi:Tannase-like family of unknown function (DUF6351)
VYAAELRHDTSHGKVVYTFGASTGQPRLQFRSEQNWADDAALSRGFMVVDNSLTDSPCRFSSSTRRRARWRRWARAAIIACCPPRSSSIR